MFIIDIFKSSDFRNLLEKAMVRITPSEGDGTVLLPFGGGGGGGGRG